MSNEPTTPTRKPRLWYALAIPEGSILPESVPGESSTSVENCDMYLTFISIPSLDIVFHDKVDALKALNALNKASIKASRLKEFASEEEARTYAQRPLTAVNGSTSKEADAEKSSIAPFKAPAPRDLVPFRRAIEAGKYKEVGEMIWKNPRFLVSSADTAVILMEGPRYNASHIAAKSDRGDILQLILDTVRDEKFLRTLYLNDDAETTTNRGQVLLESYLNTPDKGAFDTPLHFACKFGCVNTARVLLSFKECDREKKNKFDQTPRDVICDRKGSPEAKAQISELFDANFYIAVERTDEEDYPKIIKSPCRDGKFIRAAAGPLSPSQANELYKSIKSPIRGHVSPSIRLTQEDPDKGIETYLRNVSQQRGYGWEEWWPFLQQHVNITSRKGLQLMEDHLKMQKTKSNSQPLDLTDLISKLSNLDIDTESVDDDDDYVTAPSSPITQEFFVEGNTMTKWDKNAFLALKDVNVSEEEYPHICQWKRFISRKLSEGIKFQTPSKKATSSHRLFSP